PTTQVLSRDTGYRRDYDRDPFASYLANTGRGPSWPLSRKNADLPPKAVVIGVTKDDGAPLTRAYAVDRATKRVFNDTLGGEPVVVLFEPEARTGGIFSAKLGGGALRFEDGKDSAANPVIRDTQTGSVWDAAGRAVSGQHAGRALTPLPTRSTLWFAWFAAYPDTDLKVPP
ncbi:MAG: hypothetical protein CL878_16070, partial [Dehalococcoidia bacterium]|nr:hypothetical protein [Dehalococcoidia bacterium]